MGPRVRFPSYLLGVRDLFKENNSHWDSLNVCVRLCVCLALGAYAFAKSGLSLPKQRTAFERYKENDKFELRFWFLLLFLKYLIVVRKNQHFDWRSNRKGEIPEPFAFDPCCNQTSWFSRASSKSFLEWWPVITRLISESPGDVPRKDNSGMTCFWSIWVPNCMIVYGKIENYPFECFWVSWPLPGLCNVIIFCFVCLSHSVKQTTLSVVRITH